MIEPGFTTVNQPLPTCPNCGASALRTIESKQSKVAQRRRKKCDNCGYRITTHEVNDDYFQGAKQALAILANMRKLLGTPGISTPQPIVESNPIPCITCLHNSKNKCSFGFPEFDTEDAIDCNQYQNYP